MTNTKVRPIIPKFTNFAPFQSTEEFVAGKKSTYEHLEESNAYEYNSS